MQIGFIGLGKMGGNMVLRLARGSPDKSIPGGHTVVGYAPDPSPSLRGVDGVTLTTSIADLVTALQPPRVVWVMVPAGNATEGVIGPYVSTTIVYTGWAIQLVLLGLINGRGDRRKRTDALSLAA